MTVKLKFITLTLVAFNIFLRVFLALYMIISDCDETYNYWEPLNFLIRGFGKQTWEYSPQYAIRSYAYLAPYALLAKPINYMTKALQLSSLLGSSSYIFYGLRLIALAGVTCLSELHLYTSLAQNYNMQVADWFLLFTTVNTGMSHAGVALLPSSFAMQANCMALAYAIKSTRSRQPSNYVYAIVWYLIGGIVGWPFALVLGVAFGLMTLVQFRSINVWRIIVQCSGALAVIVAGMVAIDSYFYGRLIFVPLNIVLYNVFGGEGEGPEIFGTEPFSYYIANLLLNFNVLAPLAAAGSVINLFSNGSGRNFKIAIYTSIPLWAWLLIFASQAHKEERFLYPIYPYLCLSAAMVVPPMISAFSNLATLGSTGLSRRYFVRGTLQLGLVMVVTVLSLGRTLNLIQNYSAPLTVFGTDALAIPKSDMTSKSNICIAREWYHLPTSMLLPGDHYRIKFVRSGFDGLLPGDFPETFQSKREATMQVPREMNNKNLFAPDKVVPLSQCHFFVDNNGEYAPGVDPVLLQPGKPATVAHEAARDGWRIITCLPIINPAGTHRGLGRLLYIPHWARRTWPFCSSRVEYMDFCLLKRDMIEHIV